MSPATTAPHAHDQREHALRRRRTVRLTVVATFVMLAVVLAACVDARLARSPRPNRVVTRHASTVDDARSVTLRSAWASPIVRPGTPAFDPKPFIGRPVTHGAAGTRMVALTFDDGPSVDSTAVLRGLENEHAVASFFYVGDRVGGFPLIPARAIADGDDVGNHTLHHVEMVGLTRAQMLDQILSTNAILQQATGLKTVFFRPRSGHADPAARALLAELGMVMVLWDGRDGDTDLNSTVDGITRQALEHVHGGSIILMHETNPKTVAALPAIIRGLRAKGYTPVTLTTMLQAEDSPVGGSAAAAMGAKVAGRKR